MLSIITAIDENNTIGQNGAIPWQIPEEQQLFRELTTGHPIIMGRKTYETSVKRPLPNRLNIVVSKTDTFPNTLPARSFKDALNIAKPYSEHTFVIGGADIYEQALPMADVLHISHIKETYIGDTHFPSISKKDWKATRQKEYATFTYIKYQRV